MVGGPWCIPHTWHETCIKIWDKMVLMLFRNSRREWRLRSIITDINWRNSLKHIEAKQLNGVGSIDPKPNVETLIYCYEPKDKHISQPNNHEDEVRECHVQEKLTAINRLSTLFSQFPQSFFISTYLFFNKLEEDNICLICKFILWMNPSEYI